MSVEMEVTYEGNLNCKAKHLDSSSIIETSAPLDNEGNGATFSPTDLVGAALGSCILTIMGILAKRAKIDIEGTKVHVKKDMAATPSRMIGNIQMTIKFPEGIEVSEKDRKKLEKSVELCPVKQSLHPDVKIETEFLW